MRRFGVRIPTGSREEAWLLKQLGFFVPDTSIQQRFQQRVELPLDVGPAFAGQVMEIEGKDQQPFNVLAMFDRVHHPP